MVPLKPQEIRNCIYRGSLNSLLIRLNGDPNWREILGQKKPDPRQKDVELILRVTALWKNSVNYDSPMKEFLNKFMKRHKNPDEKWLEDVENRFKKTAELIVAKISTKPLRPRGVLNSSMLDSVFSTLMNNIDKLPADIVERCNNLPIDKITLSFGTNKKQAVLDRLETARKALVGS